MKANLDDLHREQWLRKRNSGELTWTTKEGKRIPVKEMSDSHLENTIKFLEKVKEYEVMQAEYRALEAEYEAYRFEHL